MQVLVRDNNVDQALKALKKKMQREGIFREMKLRSHYEKPSEKKSAREGGGDPPRAQARPQAPAARGPVADETQTHPRRPGSRGPRVRRAVPLFIARSPSASSAVNLKFLSLLAASSFRKLKFEAALNHKVASGPLNSEVRTSNVTRALADSGIGPLGFQAEILARASVRSAIILITLTPAYAGARACTLARRSLSPK